MGGSPFDDVIEESQLASVSVNAARKSMVVNVPVERAYRRWVCVENLSEFITPLRNVRRIDNTRFSCTWHQDGEERQGVLHIVLQIPCRRIAWRMLLDPLMSGVVKFEPRSKQETEVTLKVRSVSDLPTLSLRLEEYLNNFKRLVEKEEASK